VYVRVYVRVRARLHTRTNTYTLPERSIINYILLSNTSDELTLRAKITSRKKTQTELLLTYKDEKMLNYIENAKFLYSY